MIAASRGIVFIILGINMLPMVIGMSGVWLTVPFAECIAFIICMYLVKKNNRKYSIQNIINRA